MLYCWLQDSLGRVYPATKPARTRELKLDAARGERLSAQVCLRLPGEAQQEVDVSAKAAGGVSVRLRRVGYVPMPHINTGTPADEREGAEFLPGLVPDPLFDESAFVLPPEETTTVWLTLTVAPDCRPGARSVRVTVKLDGKKQAELNLVVDVAKLVLQPRRDFPVTHWFYADALLDWYRLKPWEEKLWQLLPAYFRNLTEHGQDTVYVPVFTPPLDGVKNPSQLLAVTKTGRDSYRFDWKNVKRWVDVARKAGLTRFEWCHPFTQWGVKHAIRIYDGANGDGKLLWQPETPATGATYRKFLGQYLPELEKFLRQEKIFDKSYFHVSDEPHGDEHLENYRKARALLKELAPWMKVMDALSDIRYGREGLTDLPVPSISTALEFRAENIPSWCYFCCGPRGRFLNRLFDTPLAKIRMAGWLFHRFQMQGFLHWGYNYWHERATQQLVDPFTESAGRLWPGWPHGDTFVVYPGAEGPLDSIRWEVWAESLQDMALLQTAGIKPGAGLLKPLKSFSDFPKTAQWLRAARRKALLSC